MRIRLNLIIFLFFTGNAFAQLKSPDVLLGYPLGSQFTLHYKIVSYFNQAAQAMPQQMKLEKYGETYEGRELLLAFVSSAQNIANLDEIRKNNLRLTGILKDKPAVANAPAIVWLSYNVHGNEASSSEVSMKVLYELLNPSDSRTQEWLKNTVVIIDPCLNPDGRDRYVNWYKQMAGENYNATPGTREHREPWPGGRVNHYNFDLNRDWAWQTQKETQARMKKYNQWLPQVHCDFHEQGINNPYYFAPAAEPFHEVITPWQRQFQTLIGNNHAKYFDAKGWLYFTKEVFDLFYPAYGDTYPTYNAAIGMTYEQAGHSQGGLAVVTADGDTLTLQDRIAHHFTTSMSTIEVASQNATKLVAEFSKYFYEANANGIGEYKTYVIADKNAGKLKELTHFFDMNGIEYRSTDVTAARGYNYYSGRDEVFSAKAALAVSAYQPKSTLVKVLFEPKSKLSDSVTYDITAWSLPFVYGVQAYAVKDKLSTGSYEVPATVNRFSLSAYAYLVNYAGFEDVKMMTALLKEQVKLRFAERDFTYKGKLFKKGTLIVLNKGNEGKLQRMVELAAAFNSEVTEVAGGIMETGFDFGSEKVHMIKKPTVVLLTGKGVNANAAGEVWHLFDQELQYPISLVNAEDFNSSTLKNADVLILPDGGYKFFNNKEAAADLKMWIQQGGKLIALESAGEQLAQLDWGIKLKKDEEDDKKNEPKINKDIYADLRRYENRERDGIVNSISGAIYKTELDNSHPLAFGYGNEYYTLKLNSTVFSFLKEGWNVGVIKKVSQAAGFVGSNTKEIIKDGTVMGVLPMGYGSVVFFADDPVFRSFWVNGKMLLANAIFLVGQ